MKLLQLKIDDKLHRALKGKAGSEGITLHQLLVPFLELAANSKRPDWVRSDGYGNPTPDGQFMTAKPVKP